VEISLPARAKTLRSSGVKKANLVANNAGLAAFATLMRKAEAQDFNLHLKPAIAPLEARFAAWENPCGSKRARSKSKFET